MKRVTHKHKMPTSHKKEMLALLFITGALAMGLRHWLGWIEDRGVIIILSLGIGAAILVLLTGVNRRNTTKLIAEFNEEDWKLNVWMNKVIPAWKGKLEVFTNIISIKAIDKAYVQTINGQKTLVLRDKVTNHSIYVPERIAHTSELTEFFTNFLSSKDSKDVSKEDKTTIKEFLEK
jgi:hypothetical protein